MANKTCCSAFGYILNLYALFAKLTPAFNIFINNYIIPYYSIIVKLAIHLTTYRSGNILAKYLIKAVIDMCKDQTDPMRNTILDRYIQENHTDVKKEIAMIGYRIHDLLQDNSGEVRNAAKKYLNIMIPASK